MKKITQKAYKLVFKGPIVLLCFILLCFSAVSFANVCETTFQKGSRLYFDNMAGIVARSGRKIQPDFFNLNREYGLGIHWNERHPVPSLLTALFPKDVYFINHQQYKPESSTVIKNAEMGDAIMARAHWKYKNYSFDSNVAFSIRALIDNLDLHQKQNWLASERANAVIFYFHGGGTTTTGAHTAHTMISHFRKYGIDVIAVDLPWHGEGHRQLLNNFEMEIEVLGAFAQKFIPHNVPVFVAGHSWGGVFAEQIMRMSDRPKSDFHFHPKLTGAIIMSTAITDAPAIKNYFAKKAERQAEAKEVVGFDKIWTENIKSETSKERDLLTSPLDNNPSLREVIAERQEGVNQITREVLINRQHEFPKDEHDIWSGMIVDGKISLWGGIYANIMFQMSQAMPAHKGKDYIPSLMIVGKHDSLVYLGLEKFYEIYKELENVTPIYLEKLPLLFNKEVREDTGHLLGNRLSEELLKEAQHSAPIHFTEIRKFIAKVLGLSALSLESQIALKKIQQHSLPPNTPMSERQQHTDTLRTAQREHDGDLGITTHTPDIVYIIQNYANSLSFREFLSSYTNIQTTETKSYIDLVTKTMRELERDIQNHLSLYDPKHRVSRFLNQVRQLSSSNVESVKKESQSLVNEVFIKYIENKKLQKILKNMDQQLNGLSASSSKQDFQSLSQLANSTISGHANWVSSNTRGRGRHIPRIVFEILYARTLKQAQEKLNLLNLPPVEYTALEKSLIEYYEVKAIKDRKYVPTWDAVQRSGIKEGREEKVQEVLQDIETTAKNLKDFLNSKIETNKQIKKELTTYGKLRDEVKMHISRVEKALVKANTNPPNSLRAEYEKSANELKQLELATSALDNVADFIGTHIFGKAEPLKHSEVLPLLKENEKEVNHFKDSFNQYIQNRRELVRKTILAMEEGEMGDRAQQSVIALYGLGSNGTHPQVGSNSVYLKLTDIIQKLAKLEAEGYKNEDLIVAEQDTYNNLINKLNNYLENPSKTIAQAPNLFNTSKIKVGEVILSGQKDHLEGDVYTPEGRRGAIRAIKDNASTFSQTIKYWNGLHSELPPPLPTEKREL